MITPDHQRVRMLFQQAVLLPEPQRSEYLAHECAEDPIHLAAVKELLKHHSSQPILPPESERPSVPRNKQTVSLDQASTLVESQSKPHFLERFSRRLRRERRLIWSLIALAAILFGLLGFYVNSAIHQSVRQSLEGTMTATLNQQVVAIRQWLVSEQQLVRLWARTPELRDAISALQSEAEMAEDPGKKLSSAPANLQLRSIIRRLSGSHADRVRYAVWSREGMLIADSDPGSNYLGNLVTPYGASLLSRVFDGEDVVWFPTTDGYITRDYQPLAGEPRRELAILVSIYESDERRWPIGCLLVTEIGAQQRFESFFQSAWFGETGDFFALDGQGYLVTNSRFGKQLRDAGLSDEQPDSLAAGRQRVATPGGDITAGFRPQLDSVNELPLTRAAAGVSSGRTGNDFDGYLDDRGVKVVGAWQWLDDLGLGVVAELDYDEAFESLVPLHRAFGLLIGLLGLSLLGCAAIATVLVATRRTAGIMSQIGPYKVERKIGEGGLGQVFLATHVLLKRPTALKLLKPEVINDINQRRFRAKSIWPVR